MTDMFKTDMTGCHGTDVRYDCLLEHTAVMTNTIKTDVSVC